MFSTELEDGVSYITINRGEKRNAIPMAQWNVLEKLVKQANLGPARVIVLRSKDPSSFCAGSDLNELNRLVYDVRARGKFRGSMESAFARLRAVNKPTIALIKGGCFGTGVSLALHCDMRIVSPCALFSITPARFGISYPKADLDRLTDLVGIGQAARLVYSAETISAAEAYRIGLAELIDASGDLGDATIAKIARNAAHSLCSLKATLLGRYGLSQRFDAAFGTGEFASGIDAYSRSRRRDSAS